MGVVGDIVAILAAVLAGCAVYALVVGHFDHLRIYSRSYATVLIGLAGLLYMVGHLLKPVDNTRHNQLMPIGVPVVPACDPSVAFWVPFGSTAGSGVDLHINVRGTQTASYLAEMTDGTVVGGEQLITGTNGLQLPIARPAADVKQVLVMASGNADSAHVTCYAAQNPGAGTAIPPTS